jgi:rubrerythrin
LEKSSAYRAATTEQQQDILDRCCTQVLEEALHIEDCGMSYTARMAALARTEQEKVLYSLFSADEATHFMWMKGALGEAASASKPNAFHELLSQSIHSHAPDSLVFLIQVFLEGWGLHRYSDLMNACQNPSLREALQVILQDEARHHGSGVVFNRERKILEQLSPGVRSDLLATLQQFLNMVRVGPISVLSAIEEGCGGFSRAQRIRTLEELRSTEHSQKRLNLLKGLMIHESAFELVERLENSNAFTPLSPEESV